MSETQHKSRNFRMGPYRLALLCLSIAKIFCDVAGAESSVHQDNGLQTSGQRFVEEPRDTAVVLGQAVDLACLIENKRGAFSWLRDAFLINQVVTETLYPIYASRYSMAGQDATGNSASIDASHHIANYTLHIRNVTLRDEGRYQCAVLNHTQQSQTIKSRIAKLTVLQPPTRLSVVRRRPNPAGGAASNADEQEDDGQAMSDLQAEPMMEHNQDVTSAGRSAQSSSSSSSQLEPTATAAAAAAADQQQPDLAGGRAVIGGDETAAAEGPIRMIVRQDERLRLECRADQAKPHAELFWLDHEQRPVPKRHPNGNEPLNGSYVEELIWMDPNEQKLAYATLIWSFRAQRHHSNQVLTCAAKHPAFEVEPTLRGARELKRQVILDVHHKPEVRLTKNDSSPRENRPLRFKCHAEARPSQLSYRWFIDDQPVSNDTDQPSELYIERLTRQMHLREIRCEVNNSLGVGSDTIRLSVVYAPAYVTHLLPSGLQQPPPSPLDSMLMQNNGAENSHSNNQHHSHRQQHQGANRGHSNAGRRPSSGGAGQRWPGPSELALSRQLAIGYNSGDNIQLRCDFDSNPRIQQVIWYKINTDWGSLQNITTTDADELIATGANHAIFREPQAVPIAAAATATTSTPSTTVPINHQQANPSQHHREHHKRHIATVALEKVSDGGDEVAASQQGQYRHQPQTMYSSETLDYEQMSAELIREMELIETQMRQLVNQTSGGGSSTTMSDPNFTEIIETLHSQTPSQSNIRIHEPLSWTVSRPPLEDADPLAPAAEQLAPGRTSQQSGGNTLVLKLQQQQQPSGNWSSQPLAAMSSHEPTTATANVLAKREALLGSSFMPINNADENAIGRYVCLTKFSTKTSGATGNTGNNDGGPTAMARSVYLVLRQGPRIISHRDQWAQVGSSELRVECLAQINAFVDSPTTISWFKDGKQIASSMNPDQTGNTDKSIRISVQYSPDLLFMRSILRIDGADASDFGQYNCTIANSISSDDMLINLHQLAPTGPMFTVMASLAISTVLILFCVMGLLIACTPRRKLQTKLANSSKASPGAQTDTSTADTASQFDQKSTQSTDDRSVACGRSATIGSKHYCDNGDQQQQQQRQQYLYQQSALPPSLAAASNGQLTTMGGHRSADERTDSSQGSLRGQHYHHHFRSSLRQPIVGSGGLQRSSKFAAIHESLEHKLQLGQTISSGSSGAPQSGVDQQRSLAADQQHQHQAVSELEQGSVLSRFWSRLLMRPEHRTSGNGSASGRRRIKTRPVISEPVNVVDQRSAMKRRSSLSTSLQTLGVGAATTTDLEAAAASGASGGAGAGASTSNNKNNSLNLNHINGGHLVSSKSNLIQDSTTASDGTASSGRSSSNSIGGGQQHHQNHESLNHNHHHSHGASVAGHVGHPRTPQLNYVQAANDASNYMQSPQAIWAQSVDRHQHHQPMGQIVSNHQDQLLASGPISGGGTIAPLDCNLYVNETNNNNNAYQQDNTINGHLYTNGYLTYSQTLDRTTQMTNGYTSQPNGWTEHLNQSAAPLGHYQLPMHLGEAYFPGSQQQQQPQNSRPYATVCNKVMSPLPQMPVHGQQQQQQFDMTTSSAGNYGTLPMRPASNAQCHQMVPTSDAGDAYYESNYGTLLSRSTAYKTLGYTTASPASSIQHNSHSPASSSPGSLTTHANNLSTTLQPLQESIQQVTAALTKELRHSGLSNALGASGASDNGQMTIVQSNGSTTTTAAKNLSDNGLATHV